MGAIFEEIGKAIGAVWKHHNSMVYYSSYPYAEKDDHFVKKSAITKSKKTGMQAKNNRENQEPPPHQLIYSKINSITILSHREDNGRRVTVQVF